MLACILFIVTLSVYFASLGIIAYFGGLEIGFIYFILTLQFVWIISLIIIIKWERKIWKEETLKA